MMQFQPPCATHGTGSSRKPPAPSGWQNWLSASRITSVMVERQISQVQSMYQLTASMTMPSMPVCQPEADDALHFRLPAGVAEVELRQVIAALFAFPLDPEVLSRPLAPAPVAVRVVHKIGRAAAVHFILAGVAPQEHARLGALDPGAHVVAGFEKSRELLVAVAQVDEHAPPPSRARAPRSPGGRNRPACRWPGRSV